MASSKKVELSQEQVLSVLTRPDRWRLVYADFPGKPALSRLSHLRWMDRHSHSHANPEILLCLHGRSQFGLGDRPYVCEPGSLFIIDPFRLHDTGYSNDAHGLEHLWVALLEDRVVAWRLRIHHGRMMPVPGSRRLINVADLAQPLSVLSKPNMNGQPDVLRLQLLSAAMAIVTRIVQAQSSLPPSEKEAPFELLQKLELIRRHIEQTAGKGASLENLARLAGYSRFHFLRVFRQCFGQTVHQYIDLCRVKKLRALLAEGVAKKVIAMELGFSCPSAFSRWHVSHR